MIKKFFFNALLFSILISFTQCDTHEIDSLDEIVEKESLSKTELLRASNRSRPIIPGKYIVILKTKPILRDNIEEIKEIAKGMSKRNRFHPDSISHVYDRIFQGFAIHLNNGQLKKLEKENAIDYIIPDKVVALAPPAGKGPNKDTTTEPTGPDQTIPWGISRVGGAADGAGKTAWIIDTGIDLDHPDLNVDSKRGYSAFGGRDRSPDDGNGHGTHVAGTIGGLNNSIGVVGVAAGASVVPVKVLDARGSGSYSGVLAGINYVAKNGKAGDVANMSLGGPADATLDNAVKEAAISSGIIFVIAAGNESTNVSNVSPGRANGENVYTISAMDNNDNFAYFSNYGASIDFAAPGVNIRSTYKGGGYATLSGTSMASPHAAGVLLLGTPATDGFVNGDPDGDADPIIKR